MKENKKYILICSICLVLFALIAVFMSPNKGTDLIMPSVCIVNGMTDWYVMLICLVAEALMVKLLLKESYLKSASIAMLLNVVSTVVGYVALHIVGLIVEVLFIPFTVGSFHVSHWIVNFLLIILMNACIEGLVAKLGFKLKFKEIFTRLCLINAVSFAVCFLLNLSSWCEHIFF